MTAPALLDLDGRRVLVTGGAGFIGSATVMELLRAGCSEVVVVDDMARGRPENLAGAPAGQVRLIVGDICDGTLMRGLVAGSDIVFHLAALRITQCAAEPRRAMAVMSQATFDLLDFCVESKVQKVVYASTASVYGMATVFPTPEDHPPYDNRTLYGAAKLFGEGVLRSLHELHGLDYVALRYFNAYGPRMDIHGRYTEVLVRWMERLEAGLPPIVFGDGLQTMDMVHVSDIARANVLAARVPASDTVLNVGTGTETSLLDLARMLAEVMGRDGLVPVHEKERAVNPVPRRLADTATASRLLGFTAAVGLREGLCGLVDWWRSTHSRRAGDAA